MPDGCTAIGSKAFANCTGLQLVIIPSSVVNIAEDAFLDCGDPVVMCKVNSCAYSLAVQKEMLCYCTD